MSSGVNTFALVRKMGRRFHHLPVVDDGLFTGILSDHDVRRSLAVDRIEKIIDPHEHLRLMENYDARQVMNTSVETISPGSTLAEAARQMVGYRIGALPVVEIDSLVGMITTTDVLRVCVNSVSS